ncbi:long-chain-fatty-acid--CoA ligase [Rhizocola hellebori]|uniref:Long-chain-fatty-acid--CoA ligase n=1 Tax=Rhizocola hellebori TaxID=1392758 RepID=A0A8J3VEF6_9ACTN|nr:class I adenylate-forming enzyme family protein [Rhizocola hellebori]GIH03490.1 long-chain-fatty-acid--CoA ligase [Rhizocola hellebori]
MTALAVHDLVPDTLRSWWSYAGYYPGKDIYSLFCEHVVEHPGRVAVIDDDRELTYRDLAIYVSRLAGAFVEAGIQPGEVIAVQLPSGWHAVALDLAAAAIGAVVLPYPLGRGRRDTLTLLGRSCAAAVVIPCKVGGTAYDQILEEIRPQLPYLRVVVIAGIRGANSLEDWLTNGPPLRGQRHVASSAPARILVSSGSEADPKMIIYSHDALAGGRGAFIGGLHDVHAPMRNLFLVPLASSFGSSGTAVTIARHGGTLIVQSRFDAGLALELIEAHRPYLVFGVPTMYQMMLDHPRMNQVDTSSLRAVVAGGSRVDPATVAACRERFRTEFINCYGSADGVNCTTDLRSAPAAVHSAVGVPNPQVAAIRIVGDDGRDMAEGEVGEIWGLGPMSPMCYVDPEFDQKYRAQDGWVRTGDLGYLDKQGFLHVVGRRNEIIIRGGRNLSPVEVELLLAQHPAVKQVACVGIADPRMGERMCACVSLRDGQAPPTLSQLTQYLVDTHGLEPVKLPELLQIFDTLPLSAAGKIDKRWLRDQVSSTPQSPASNAPTEPEPTGERR